VADKKRRYDDEQVGLILRRATELATTGATESDTSEGLSLVELEQIALEAGIDPALIRRAAQEVDGTGDAGPLAWILGAPLTIRVHRVVDVETPEDFFDDLLAEIQISGIGHGTASLVGRTLSWKGAGEGQQSDSCQITISSRDGQTELVAEWARRQTAGGLMGGLVGGGGVGMGAGLGIPIGINLLGSVLAAVALPVVAVGGTYALARKLFQSGNRKRTRQLERLLDTLVTRIQDEVARRLAESERQPSLPPTAD